MSTRFQPKGEVRRIVRAFDTYQQEVGTTVLWFHFDPGGTVVDSVYDESSSAGGRMFYEPVPVEVLSAIVEEGREDTAQGTGFYTTDTLILVVGLEQLRRKGVLGITRESIRNERVLDKDRVVYDDIVWGVQRIGVRGQVAEQDVILGIFCTEEDPDELHSDPQFDRWAGSGPACSSGSPTT